MKTTLFIFSVLIGISTLASAETKTYTLENQKFSIDIPGGWKDLKDIAGSPLTLFGPENQDGHRTVVLISPTGKEDTKKFFSGMKSRAADYQNGREDWLKGNFGEATSFDPYQEIKWTGIEKAQFFGYNYEIPNGKFHERSIYILCDGNKLFYIKSLVPEKYEGAHNTLVDQTIKSLKCEKSTVKTAQN